MTKSEDRILKESRNIWHRCFPNDPEVFLDLYFSRVFKASNTLLLQNDKGETAAHVQCLPYELNWQGLRLPAGYISGACTIPEERNKGLMKNLMQRALRKMYERGDFFSFLIPAEPGLYDFYRRKSSFETAFYKQTVSCLEEVCKNGEDILSGAWDDFIRRAEKQRIPGGILHNTAQLQAVAEDLNLAGGGIARYPEDSPEVSAICWYRTNDGVLYIPDIYGPNHMRRQLIDKLMTKLQCHRLQATLPASQERREPKGMLRLLRIPEIMRIYAAGNQKFDRQFILRDEQIPENNGVYTVRNGLLIFELQTSEQDFTKEVLTPEQLTEIIFAETPLFMSMMLE
ncbi:Predicted acetyltransferase involved in intracellular survival and related acetyltransferases [Porphyromonas macacae]|uniref:Predicted acetyltransferase involved in intracellular survival and related acetyltransferases n=1 Tax=Porphyromonas macacae TaxID=28115 RepID=A0A379E6S5_9PORP|nr:GNAT family N-acetyltransferase [Porphyromonas macacae]SUB88032.1 Predicted acetyltransferase involved in intracellular survival and related acetyltransferases [Porphyromonas macacae]